MLAIKEYRLVSRYFELRDGDRIIARAFLSPKFRQIIRYQWVLPRQATADNYRIFEHPIDKYGLYKT